MSPFPAQYSTLSAAALKEHVAVAYGLDILSCKFLLRGVSDTYVLASAKEQYILKIYREQHRSLEEIESEVELLDVLKDKGAGVSYAIVDVSGKQLQRFDAAEGTRYGVLFTYAIGKVIYNLSNEQLKQVGHQMAGIHNITSAVELKHPRKEYTTESTMTGPLRIMEPAFADLPDEYAYLNNTAQRVIEKLNSFDTSVFGYGYCHYDFLPKNFHFDNKGRITFFDFDFAGKGLLANDLMSFFVHFFMEATAKRLTEEEASRMFNVFVAGYREVRPLHEDELKAIPYLGFGFWVFYLGFQYEHFDDWSNLFFGPRFIKDRVGHIKLWVDKHCEF